jgi:hypothetical protein
MIKFDEKKSVVVDGLKINEKAGGVLQVTLASDFRTPQPAAGTSGMVWGGQDAIREVYTEGIEAFGELWDGVLVLRRRPSPDAPAQG